MSELRQDLVSGDWVIIAPGRAARPQFLDVKRPVRKPGLKSECPFEESFLREHGDWPPIASYPANTKNWRMIVIPNKYPALAQAGSGARGSGKICSVPLREGIYAARTGVGVHNLIITRDHNKNFAELAPRNATEVFGVFQKLCKQAAEDPCAVFAVPFWNWGQLAGASVWHPHYQFLSLPVVPAHSAHSLASVAAFHKKHHRCVRCDIIAFERREKKRVIAENVGAIAVVPYAAKLPFEVRVMPKRHAPYFYKTSARTIADVASLTQDVLRRMKKYMNDPDVNAFIHEAPLDDKRHDYHHWHVEIIPRVSTPAGFELSTGIFINTTAPESATAILRGER